MSQQTPNPYQLPDNLPIPQDDGACAHLIGMAMPAITLRATTGEDWRLDHIACDQAVLYIYPATGVPGQDPIADWDNIPGAPGCTLQSLGFGQLYQDFLRLGYPVFGISAQAQSAQAEFCQRTQVPQVLLSDPRFELQTHLALPTFQAQGQTFYKRLALIVQAGTIQQVFYPVFPPDQCAKQVLSWLQSCSNRTWI